MNARFFSVAMFSALVLDASPAWACTLCHSRTAEQVRAAVFGGDFWPHLGAVIAPMPVLFAAVALVRRIVP